MFTKIKTYFSNLGKNFAFNALASAFIASLMVAGHFWAKAKLSDFEMGAAIFVVVFILLYLVLNNNEQIKAKFDSTIKKL